MRFVSDEAQNLNIVAVILKSTQQPGCAFVTSFCPRTFVHMASDNSFNYRNDNVEDSEVGNRLEKIDLVTLCRIPSQF